MAGVARVVVDRLLELSGLDLDQEEVERLTGALESAEEPRLLACLLALPLASDSTLAPLLRELVGGRWMPAPAELSTEELTERLDVLDAALEERVELEDGTPVRRRDLAPHTTWYDHLEELGVPVLGGSSESTDTLALTADGLLVLSDEGEGWQAAPATLEDVLRWAL